MSEPVVFTKLPSLEEVRAMRVGDLAEMVDWLRHADTRITEMAICSVNRFLADAAIAFSEHFLQA